MSKMEKKEKNCNAYSELPEGEETSATKIPKREPQKGKENRDVGKKRIYKRNNYLKERNNPERFIGEGINFRAKIIGIEDVFDARGNRMCQGALQKLKENVKLMGAHKQRIILNVSLNGIVIKDEKTGEILHHHPIHKISCISQDTKDNRAFGFVYGCPQTGHRFFAIKTEKAASQVVVTLRDLFLVALEIKKKEIEKASDTLKEDEQVEIIEENSIDSSSNGHAAVNSFFTSTSQSDENLRMNHDLLYSNTVLLPEEALQKCERIAELEPPPETLLDLQSEMDILQQGISQMDQSIASRSLGFSLSEEEVSELTSVPTSVQFKLDKQLSSLYQETMSISSRSSSTSDYIYAAESKQEENDDITIPKKEPSANLSSAASEGCCSSSLSVGGNSSVSETSQSSSTVEDRYAVFQDIDSLPSIFDNPGIVKVPEEKGILDVSKHEIEKTQNGSNEEVDEDEPEEKSSTPVPFSELDPLGNQPYVDKKDFFQDIKNPPKKVLKDLVGASFEYFDSLKKDDFSSSTNSGKCFVLSADFNNSDDFSKDKEEDLRNPSPMPPLKQKTVVEPPFSGTELFPENSFPDKSSWECKNPFNPFLLGEDNYPDIPPPNSPPPPPPPPRIPSLPWGASSSSSLSSSQPPPPRPPSRVSCAPTPPLPKRKVPLLGSTQRAWFSFDQESVAIPSSVASSLEQQKGPPLPSPARKLPPTNTYFNEFPPPVTKYESPPPVTKYESPPHVTKYESPPHVTKYESPHVTKYESPPPVNIKYESLPPENTKYESPPSVTKYESLPPVNTKYESLPPVNTKYESPPSVTEYESPPLSASNSPATIKRNNYSVSVTENGDSSAFNRAKDSKIDAEAAGSPYRSASEDTYSVEYSVEENDAFDRVKDTSKVDAESPYRSVSEDAFNVAVNPFSVQTSSCEFSANGRQCPSSPPVLPPKPGSFSRARPSPVKKKTNLVPPSASSYSSSVAAGSSSSNGTNLIPSASSYSGNGTRSSSSVPYRSSDDVAFGSRSEVSSFSDTVSTNGQSDVAVGRETVRLLHESSNGEVADLSPDSIFRRPSDPFADDFFLTLHKRSEDHASATIDRHSDTAKAPT